MKIQTVVTVNTCPIGTYNDQVSAETCISCPPGWTTLQPGSTRDSQCRLSNTKFRFKCQSHEYKCINFTFEQICFLAEDLSFSPRVCDSIEDNYYLTDEKLSIVECHSLLLRFNIIEKVKTQILLVVNGMYCLTGHQGLKI